MNSRPDQDLAYYRNLENRVVTTDEAILAMQRALSILAVGTYDMLHPGHVDFLTRAKEHIGNNGLLVVGLVPDADVLQRKGRETIFNVYERAQLLASLRAVDLAFPFYGSWDDFQGLILKAHPAFFALNSDDPSNEQKKELITRAGGTPVVFERTSLYSTSGIIQKIKQM
jgi:cytidyltransferase-like protein